MPVKCHHHFYNFSLFVFFPEKSISVLGALQTHWLNLAGVTKHIASHGKQNEGGKEGYKQIFLQDCQALQLPWQYVSMEAKFEACCCHWSGPKKMISSENEPSCSLTWKPAHPQPSKKPQPSSILPSLIEDLINTWGRERQKIPHNENEELPFMQANNAETALLSTRLKALCEILHIKVSKILRASWATASQRDRRGVLWD